VVDLVAIPLRERASQDCPLIGQDSGVSVAQSMQEQGRTLDVGEEERDRALRERRRGVVEFTLRNAQANDSFPPNLV
jgi:hypothetical protein